MHTLLSDVVTIVFSIAAALLFLYILQRLWAPAERQRHNDVVGPSVNVIGTTYAVIVAFMLSGVWLNFRQAENNAEQESNSLVNLFRISNGLAAQDRDRLHQFARQYAQAMLDHEWRAMTEERIDPEGYQIIREIWTTLNQVEPHSVKEQISLDRSIAELSRMTEYRRIRLLQCRSQLPAILWAVLIVGAVVTIGASCLFGVDDLKMHILQVFSLTFLIVLVLVAIGNIDRPFQGRVTVGPGGFRFALETFDREMPTTPQ